MHEMKENCCISSTVWYFSVQCKGRKKGRFPCLYEVGVTINYDIGVTINWNKNSWYSF